MELATRYNVPEKAVQETILIADDDAEIRDILRCTLESAGYVTAGAADGDEVLTALRELQFDLLITDLQMPECDGLELLDALRYRQSAPKVIAMSGAWDGACLPAASKLGALAAIHKPWRKQELLNLVRAVLDGETVTSPPQAVRPPCLSRECRGWQR
jgi:two-component system OmpR family response regulator